MIEKIETIKAKCLVCGKEFDYKVIMCCDGSMCGCMGQPTEPQVCSVECYSDCKNDKCDSGEGILLEV